MDYNDFTLTKYNSLLRPANVATLLKIFTIAEDECKLFRCNSLLTGTIEFTPIQSFTIPKMIM